MPKPKAALRGLTARCGATLRKRYSEVYFLLKRKRRCPNCGSWGFRREAFGIWICPSCKYKMAGKAYTVS